MSNTPTIVALNHVTEIAASARYAVYQTGRTLAWTEYDSQLWVA